VKYTDPDGEAIAHGGPYPGWSEDAPQSMFGYDDWMDDAASLLGFNINGTKLDFGSGNLRLWKGDYGELGRLLATPRGIPFRGGVGGEIGFYDYNGNMIRGSQLSETIGLVSSTMQLFSKGDNRLLAEYEELSGWVTAFNAQGNMKKEDMFSVNTFEFNSTKQAKSFADNIRNSITSGEAYRHNGNESIVVTQQGKYVVVT
jgi:hypothetical protein